MGRVKGLYKRGRIWWLALQVDGHRQFLSLETEDEAVAVRKALEIRGDPIRRRAGAWETEVKRYLADGAATGRMSAATRETKAWVLEAFARECGVSSPEEVTRGLVERWHQAVRARASASTANDYLAHVRPFLAWLVRQRKLRENPAAGIAMYATMRSPRKTFLPAAEVARLLEVVRASGDWEMEFVLLAGFDAGMRRLEMVEARPEWFARAPGVVWIERTATFQPKDREERFVPMTRRFQEFMAGREWPGPWCLRPEKAHGKARYRYDIRAKWRRLVREQGLALSMHDMRRSFASNLAMAGVSLYKIARWLGDNPRVVEERYAHLSPSDGEIERVT